MRYITNPVLDDPLRVRLTEDELKQLATSVATECVDHYHARGHDFTMYVGPVGAYWALWYVGSSLSNGSPKDDELCRKAYDFCKRFYKSTNKCAFAPSDRHSFICGPLGVFTITTIIAREFQDFNFEKESLARVIESAKYFASTMNLYSFGSNEIFVGRAGVLIALASLRAAGVDLSPHTKLIKQICRLTVVSGEEYAAQLNHSCPLMYQYHGSLYLGLAHGLGGILYSLLLFYDLWRTELRSVDLVRASIDFMIDKMTPSSKNLLPVVQNTIPRPGDANELVHWCHGSTGAIILYAKAYLIWNDQKHLNACKMCAEVVWQRGLLKKGPGICHGVSGSGYAFLLMYRLTKKQIWFDRAIAFAALLQEPAVLERQRRPDNPYSLFEGLAGAACFYVDCIQPEKASFPFMNAFW